MTEFGREIAVDGVRPVWLADDVRIQAASGDWGWYGGGRVDAAHAWAWEPITAIRLPADHFAYAALDAGFTPWAGGDAAPEDWDGGEVLLRDGKPCPPENLIWRHGLPSGKYDIIGYRSSPTPTAADPALATYDPQTHVAVPLMTEAEAWDNLRSDGIDTMSGLAVGYIRALKWAGLIRPETLADRFTRETGIAVTADVAKALEWGR